MARTYNMTKRTNDAQKTKDRIIKSTEVLLATGPLKEVTLPAIARGAKVTVQTVMRQMGSRDGCLSAVAKLVSERVDSQRGNTKPGDVKSAVSALMNHYESESGLILNLLEQANKDEAFAKRAVETGRIYHRNWVDHCFGSLVQKFRTRNYRCISSSYGYLYLQITAP